jgi:hypothetical protein
MIRLPYVDRVQLRALLRVRAPGDVRAYFSRGVRVADLLDAAAGNDLPAEVAERILARLPRVAARLLGPPPTRQPRPAPVSPWRDVLPARLDTAYRRLFIAGRLAALSSATTDDRGPRLRLIRGGL